MRMPRTAVLSLLVAMLGACAKPVPPEKHAYVGEWRAPNMTLRISQDGRVVYKRSDGAVRTSIDGPIKDFHGDDFSVGIGFVATTFVVAAPPHADGSVWKMTVDGVELVRQQ